MVDDLLFTTDAIAVHAIEAGSGKRIWEYKPERATPGFGGVAVGGGMVYAGLSDANIVALDERSGQLRWKSFIGNGPSPMDASHVGLVSNAPILVNGLLISGLSGGDWGAPGKVVALDAKTGKAVWSFAVIPAPGAPGSESWPADGKVIGRGGGAVWTQGAADPKLHMVYYGTGNPVPQLGGETRPGNNLYTDSVIALDTVTGGLRWHFQLTHHDLWEMDSATPLVLYDTQKNGVLKRAIAAMRTDGYLFLLDRLSGKPIFPVEERRVKQDIRLRTSPTQPFPVHADKFGPACADPAVIPPGFEVGCQFDPIYFDHQNRVAPLSIARQAPMSFDPQTGYFYVMGGVTSVWMRRVNNPGILLMSHPPGSQEYGIYGAIDSRSNKLIWQRRSTWGMATGSGALTTAGGLLFHMEGDGSVVASDAGSGATLWTFQTGFLGSSVFGNAGGVPIASYEVGGIQYVVVPMGKGLWAFKLDGPLPPQKALPAPGNSFGYLETVKQLPINGTAVIKIAVTRGGFIDGPDKFIDEYAFDPTRSRIGVDTPITWVNDGSITHTIMSTDGAWTTGEIPPGHSVTMKIMTAGNYEFFSKESPWGRGQLVVQQLGADQESAHSVNDSYTGIFTSEQARRGESEFAKSCSSCHMGDLTGSERIPALVGDAFLNKWKPLTLNDLYEKISTTMPPNAPRSLADQSYADVLSFLLQANGYRPGINELKADATLMRSLTVTSLQ